MLTTSPLSAHNFQRGLPSAVSDNVARPLLALWLADAPQAIGASACALAGRRIAGDRCQCLRTGPASVLPL
jgi:hypothetical protein